MGRLRQRKLGVNVYCSRGPRSQDCVTSDVTSCNYINLFAVTPSRVISMATFWYLLNSINRYSITLVVSIHQITAWSLCRLHQQHRTNIRHIIYMTSLQCFCSEGGLCFHDVITKVIHRMTTFSHLYYSSYYVLYWRNNAESGLLKGGFVWKYEYERHKTHLWHWHLRSVCDVCQTE